MTVRAFKLKDLEDRCEDYGQTASYLGTIEEYEDGFKLDKNHFFKTGEKVKVCSNTANMLVKSRFGKHF